MNSFNFASLQYNSFLCYIDKDNNIVQADMNGNQQVIGKTVEAYNELEQTTTEYYNKLVEMGVIIPPKTPEEQNKELQDTLLKMTEMMSNMQKEIEVLKNDGYKCNSTNSNENVSKRKNIRSSSESTTDDTGDK